MPLKRYSNKEPIVLLWVLLPYIIFLNTLVFGTCIFNSASVFFKSTLYGTLYISVIYFLFGVAATLVKKRFPSAGDMFRRIAVLLPLFYVMNAITMPGYYFVYNQWPAFALYTQVRNAFMGHCLWMHDEYRDHLYQ